MLAYIRPAVIWRGYTISAVMRVCILLGTSVFAATASLVPLMTTDFAAPLLFEISSLSGSSVDCTTNLPLASVTYSFS